MGGVMTPRRRARAALIAGAALGVSTQAGCYVYTVPAGQPAPGARYAFEITDQGRVSLADRIGSGVERIEGTLVGQNDQGYLVSVSGVKSIGSGASHWAGERVALRPEFVGRVRERRLSGRRTALAVGTAALAIGAFVATRAWAGGGPSRQPSDPPPCCDQ